MHGGHHHAHPSHSHAGASHVPDSHARLMRLATTASVAMALVLVVGKGIVWWISDSLSMLSSLTDSLFDIVTSLVNFMAVRYALKPADDDHRFGHTGIEDIAGLAQFLFIVGAMLIILLQSAERLANPEPLKHEFWGIAVSLAAMLMTGVLVAYQTYVARVTGSLIVASDRMHYASDILFNGGVLLAFGVSMAFGVSWADPVFAILIALTVLWATRSIGIRAFHNLMNREMPDEDTARIIALLATMPQVKGYHNLKTRYLGMKALVQLHLDVDKSVSFLEAHALTDEVEHAISGLFSHAEVIVHADPV